MAVGIVCELNPFHNGHAYLLSEVRRRTGEKIVCALSGNFVQRAEYACADKAKRAGWAKAHGADLVLENPFPFSCASADYFARSAIGMLLCSGLCDTLAFGSETGTDERMFYEAAEILLEPKTERAVRAAVRACRKIGYAEARADYVAEAYGNRIAALLMRPNDLLGVSYAKAALRLQRRPRLLPVQRQTSQNCVPSRQLRESACPQTDAQRYCPPDVAADLAENGLRRVDPARLYAAASARILFADTEALAETAEFSRGDAFLWKRAAAEHPEPEAFFAALGNRHQTRAKHRRMMLYLLAGVRKTELEALPAGALLLAVGKDGAALLKARTEAEARAFPIYPRMAALSSAPDAAAERARREKERAAEALFERMMM